MSANFLDVSGAGMGFDNHLYFTAAGPVPVPVPKTVHWVGSKHAWASKSWRIAPTVTTGGHRVLQSSWAMLVVLHIPLPTKPPHPAAEGITLAAIILASSSSPQLSAHSVTGGGQPLCTAIQGLFGLNLDCGDMPFPGLMADINANTVKTSPTLGDYLSALLSAACSIGYAWAVAGLTADKFPSAKGGAVLVRLLLEQALASLGIAVVMTLLDAAAVVVHPAIDLVNYAIGWVASNIQADTDAPTPNR
jgi:hypothetical protein